MSDGSCKCEDVCICIEHGDINWDTFLGTVASLASPTFESVVAELVDNSLDHKATRVEVELFGKNDSDFSVIVYDNGTGLAVDAEMKKAFSLAHLSGTEPTKKGGKYKKTGKFNFGLKISPISRCENVALMSTAGGELIHRRLDKRQVEVQKRYGSITSFSDHKAVLKARQVLEEKNGGPHNFKTAVVLSGFTKFLNNHDYSTSKYYDQVKHLCNYFGLLYQKILDDNQEITIRFTYPGSVQAGKDVVPLDPFWKEFTPGRIDERLKITDERNPNFVDLDERYILERFKEWGTISTGTMQIPYKHKNPAGNIIGEPNVSVTGYCIPSRNLHSRLPTKMKKSVFDRGESGSPSNLLGGPKLGGIYFYREGRLIAFGDNNKDPDANQGWYELLSNVESRHNIVRIEIEVPIELDTAFGLTGSKDKYTPPHDFKKQLITNLQIAITEPALRANIGDGTRSFWLKDAGKDSKCAAMAAVRESSLGGKGNPSKIKKECQHCSGDPKPWHHIDTVCPKKPCDICGKVGECHNGCDYECSHEGCGENHNEANCDLNCPYCEYPDGAGGHPDGETCPQVCPTCEKISCGCPCPKGCGKDRSHCDGGCDEEENEESKPSTISFFGNQVVLKLERYNSAEKSNEELIEEAMKHLDQSD